MMIFESEQLYKKEKAFSLLFSHVARCDTPGIRIRYDTPKIIQTVKLMICVCLFPLAIYLLKHLE